MNDVIMTALSGALRMWAVGDKHMEDNEIHDLLAVVWVCRGNRRCHKPTFITRDIKVVS